MYASGVSGAAELLSGLADELVGGNHQRGHEILRGRRVKVCRRDAGVRFW